MQLATTTGDFERFTDSHEKRIEYVSQAGFRHIDLSLYTVKEGDPLFGSGWREETRRLKETAARLGADFVQAHAPNVNPLKDAVTARERLLRAIKICGTLGIRRMAVHGGWHEDVTDREVWFKMNRDFFHPLLPVLEENNVNLLCENTTKANMPNWYYPVTGRDLRDFARFVDHPNFHVCWDTGHANIEGTQYGEILDLGDELYAVHFNDNRGSQDEHVIPYMGTMNIDEVMCALTEIGFTGPLTFESGSALRPARYWLGDRRPFEKENKLSEPPLILQQSLEKFMYETGVYILKSYDLWES